ncbi:MAG: 23S rRNA (guanosine(2251)-2'-O)-methyltransferase RlmB [Clostridia bacterium]|nr:23S rRNA (guanosine(2251)-2'-O)-methyltransferase RlmB [Clostridia bacterium]
MAFYDAYQKGGKRNSDRRNDTWEEEGSRYRGKYQKNNSDRYDDGKQGRRGASSAHYRSDSGYNTPSSGRDSRYRTDGRSASGGKHTGKGQNSHYQPSRNDRRPYRREDQERFESREAEKSYRDFEHVPVNPPKEENLPTDNLLVGRNPIREAIKSGRNLEKLLVARGELQGSAREILSMARDAHVVIQEVDKSRLDDIAPHHQGMIAYASAYKYSTIAEMLSEAEAKGEDPFLIVLDGVTDPHNLGAVIRSAECAGAHGVIVPERRSVGLTPAAVKASAGAIEHMKVARVSNLTRTLEDLKKAGMWLYAVTMDGKDYRKIDFAGPCVLVVGSEGEGISRLVLESCDVEVSLPMKGHIDSLNASVAAGIMMYRVLESRRL